MANISGVDMNIPAVVDLLKSLQDDLVSVLRENDDSLSVIEDNWQHKTGGGGCTRALSSDSLVESGGVNFSHIHGQTLPVSAKQHKLYDDIVSYQAIGMSTVIHSHNPFVPTSHANLRCFIGEQGNGETIWWFGGGYDLTPYYGFVEDCILWHEHARAACLPFGESIYPEFKAWCDEYFYLPHRQEPRGIGGLFFDHLNRWPFAHCLEFVTLVGQHYLQAWQTLIQRRSHMEYTAQQKAFQRYRRGRYVEFNLVYDRGTQFGLQSGGRTESILISLPKTVNWQYNYQPQPGSPEAKLTQEFLIKKDWV